MTAALLRARQLVVGHGTCAILAPISFEIVPGQLTALLGVNGAGKSTLLRTLCALQPVLGGSVEILHQQEWVSLFRLSPSVRAHYCAFVPQLSAAQFGYEVIDWLLMACVAQRSTFAQPTAHDRTRAMDALAQLSVAQLARRRIDQLSGGQMQLVSLARALLQQARIILADEPCANLDLVNRQRVLAALQMLAAQGITVLFSTHEPDHALQIAHHVLLFEVPHVHRMPIEQLSAQRLTNAYGAQINVIPLPDGQSHVKVGQTPSNK